MQEILEPMSETTVSVKERVLKKQLRKAFLCGEVQMFRRLITSVKSPNHNFQFDYNHMHQDCDLLLFKRNARLNIVESLAEKPWTYIRTL
jgi:hypothetical protein